MNNIPKPKQILAISVLTILLSNGAIAAPDRKPYGLGIPISSGTGGAVRSANSLLVPLAPEDGGRTASERPTFYWYLPSSGNFPYKTIFELRDPTNRDDSVVFKAEGIANKSGIYKLTLPATSPGLKPEKVYVWQLRLRGSAASSNLQAIGSIVLSKVDGDMQKAIAQANNNLEKAKVYSNFGYWFDALSIYSNQIETSPQEKQAYKMRAEMMLEVLTPKNSDSDTTTNVKNLVDKINGTTTADVLSPISILEPKN